MLSFSSKAETLEKLESLITKAKILPQIRFCADEWDHSSLKNQVEEKGWSSTPLIVRSSSSREDCLESSLAGHFVSIANVKTIEDLYPAVQQVVSSYGRRSSLDQIFIQPMLSSIRLSGVAFSCDPRTGAPYRLINYDDVSGSHDSVTSGSTNQLKIFYSHRLSKRKHPHALDRVLEMLEELESFFIGKALDVEFAMTDKGELFLFQVRPLAIKIDTLSLGVHKTQILAIQSTLEELSKPHPHLHGQKNLFGIMPDWNPAEIIGRHPRPLAFSLYQEIVTDRIWAEQREEYGYRDLRGSPLLINLHGLPYVDVRTSFNSFLPANLDDHLAEKLVNYYLAELEAKPHLHDKVEFDIVYSCYTFDFPQRLAPLKRAGFSDTEISHLTECLKSLTYRIIDPCHGIVSKDLRKVSLLCERFHQMKSSELNGISKIHWFLEDCKRFGTLPFAGIARGAFIAIQLLHSLEHLGVLSVEEIDAFMSSLNSICSQMQRDRARLSKLEFLKLYGHLREGTYDILTSRYDEDPDSYFDWSSQVPLLNRNDFVLKHAQIEKIDKILLEHGFPLSANSLLEYIRNALEGREYAKFMFTKNVSEILRLIGELGEEYGLFLDDCSYLDIQDIKKLYNSSQDIKTTLFESVSKGRENYRSSSKILLPPLITNSQEVWSFMINQTEPNYITHKKAAGPVLVVESFCSTIAGKIVMIPSADPGYDWIFTHRILGLITMYGGVNSHMAIRSAELGIPSVIGAGEVLYHEWSQAQALEIDCENKQVKIIR